MIDQESLLPSLKSRRNFFDDLGGYSVRMAEELYQRPHSVGADPPLQKVGVACGGG